MSTHKEEPKDKYIEAREKVLGILIDEYKQNCNFDALMRIMAIVEEYGGTVEPTPPSQIEEEPMSEKEFQLMVSGNQKAQHEAWMGNSERYRELLDLTYKNELLRSEVYELKLEALKDNTK